MSLIVLIGIGLLLLLIFARKDVGLVKIVLGVLDVFLIVVCILGYLRKDDIFLSIPGTRIDDSGVIEVDNNGSFYLESSQGTFLDNKFYLPASENDLYDWLNKTKKNVFMYIVSGDKITYSRNLGVYREGMESEIHEAYSSWKSYGTIPSETVRYWFYVFYIDV